MSGIFQVVDIYEIRRYGDVLVGQVVSGSLTQSSSTTIEGMTFTIKRMESKHVQLATVSAGESAGITFNEPQTVPRSIIGKQIEFK